jgi:hypothetical protein
VVGGVVHAELDKLVAALDEFYAREAYLLEKDAGERTLSHRLAVYIERQFPDWEVDCDYNRLGERRLLLPKGTIVSTDDALGKSVYPDIVVHRRAVPKNLLAVEVRKAANHQPIEHDRHKLQALTDPDLWFAYWIGVLVIVARRHVVGPEVYVGGVIDRPLTAWFAERLKRAGLAAGS